MSILKFKDAFVSQKENKGIPQEEGQEKALRLLKRGITSAEQDVKVHTLAVKKAEAKAVDQHALEAAKLNLDSALQLATAAKEDAVDRLTEEFNGYWGYPDLNSITAAFNTYKALVAVKDSKVDDAPEVISARKHLASLTENVELDAAKKGLAQAKSNLKALETFMESAL